MLSPGGIPLLSTEQMVEVDRLMVGDFSISLTQMMENAGRNLADLARRLLGGLVEGRRVAVICGAGNNGGGGLVAARYLHNWGAEISLASAFDPSRLKEVPAHQWQILRKMGFELDDQPDLKRAELILDALIGYGLRGDPRPPAAGWIERANNAGVPILALDIPSGLDATTGATGEPCIKARVTMTLALPKSGLFVPQAAEYVGQLYLADIGVPPELYPRIGIQVPGLFAKDTIIQIS